MTAPRAPQSQRPARGYDCVAGPEVRVRIASEVHAMARHKMARDGERSWQRLVNRLVAEWAEAVDGGPPTCHRPR